MDRLITIKNLTKGNTHRFEIHVGENITGWKIWAKMFDDLTNCVEVSNALAGGSASEIVMENLTEGIFTIIIPKDETTCFANKGHLEIQIVDTNNERYTILNGEQSIVELRDTKITEEN